MVSIPNKLEKTIGTATNFTSDSALVQDSQPLALFPPEGSC